MVPPEQQANIHIATFISECVTSDYLFVFLLVKVRTRTELRLRLDVTKAIIYYNTTALLHWKPLDILHK